MTDFDYGSLSEEEKDRLDGLFSKDQHNRLADVFGDGCFRYDACYMLTYEQILALESVMTEFTREQKADLWAEGAYAVTNGKWDLPADLNPYGETSQEREEREYRETHRWDEETRQWKPINESELP